MNQLFYNIASGIVRQIRRENIRSDCSVKRFVTALMPSLLFRCFWLFLPHLRTLAQEERSQNCLRFGTGGPSLCFYQLLSPNVIFFPTLTTAACAKKKILANRFADAISEHYRDLRNISCNRKESKQCTNTWQIIEVSNSMKRSADNSGNHADL